MPENTTADHNNLPDKRALLRKAALEYHEFPKPGKISIAATKQMVNQHDLALAYSPGVAAPCEEIVKDPNAAFKYTSRGNLVGVVTNGAQPLGGVVASKEIYDTFMAAGGPEYMLEFPHGYTYSAHPVACAAGIAALDILQKEDMIGRVKALAPYFEQAVHSLKGAKHVADIRNFGLAAGFTIAPLPGEPAKRPYEIAMNCWKKGFYVRYGGDTIQLAPPFISERAEIDRLVNALGDALAETA